MQNKLTIQEYQKLAKRTCPDLGSLEKNLLHMRLGIITEVGEVLDIFKKNLAYGKPIDKVNLGEECADVAWYLVNVASFENIELNDTTLNTSIIGDIKSETGAELILYRLLSMLNNIHYNFKIIAENDKQVIINCLRVLKSVCEDNNIDFQQCLYKNIEKLQIRYPDKFDADLALNRNLDAERKVLEGDK